MVIDEKYDKDKDDLSKPYKRQYEKKVISYDPEKDDLSKPYGIKPKKLWFEV